MIQKLLATENHNLKIVLIGISLITHDVHIIYGSIDDKERTLARGICQCFLNSDGRSARRDQFSPLLRGGKETATSRLISCSSRQRSELERRFPVDPGPSTYDFPIFPGRARNNTRAKESETSAEEERRRRGGGKDEPQKQ